MPKVESTTRQPPEEHPSYAVMQLFQSSRNQPGEVFFDSDHFHQNYISIRICRASVQHDCGHDFVFPRERLLEARMTLQQWATMQSSIGRGEGVPCTLEWLDGETIEDPPLRDALLRHMRGYEQMLADNQTMLTGLLAELDELLKNPKGTKGWASEARRVLGKVVQNLEHNAAWHMTTFERHVDATVDEARMEVAHYMNSLVGAYAKLGLPAPSLPLLPGAAAVEIEEDDE